MYRQYLKELEKRPKTSSTSKTKKTRRKRRNSAPSLYSGSTFTIVTYGPKRDKTHSSKIDKRLREIQEERPEKPKSGNKKKQRSRSNSPKGPKIRPRSKSPKRSGSPKEPKIRPRSKSPKRSRSPKEPKRRPGSKSPDRKSSENERPGTEDEINTAFHVTKVDYHIVENTKAHHTNAFECTEGDNPDLVLRRGQFFCLTLTFDRTYEKETHDLFLTFTTGQDPKPPKGTSASVELDEEPDGTFDNYKQWYAKMVDNDKQNCKIKVEIRPPSNCIIGSWDFSIQTSFRNKPSDKPLIFKWECQREIIILLNPWCSHDLVYYPKEDDLREYIMLEYGCVYQGSCNQINAKAWDHGQFDSNILEICLHLIRKYFNYNVDHMMGNPIELTRAISSVVNSAAPCGGCLWGNWSGDYSDGKKPWQWKSSTAILQDYFDNGGPVRYGQCWVFSAVTTTICRAIGIPCRSITNFASAHDTDASCDIDQEYYFDSAKDKHQKIPGGDSIWNFHVWNDCWMARPDIGKQFGGWQAVDATPQEMSDGQFRCGPASLNAIKMGDIQYSHDTSFVFAEVNGDIKKWERLSPNKWRLMEVQKSSVGKSISTKEPDGVRFMPFISRRQDITHEYKYPEGSEEERLAVERAGRIAGDKHQVDEDLGDVQMYIKMEDESFYGDDFSIRVYAKNIAKSRQTLNLTKRSVDILKTKYTGEMEEKNPFCEKTLDGTLTIPYMEEKEFTFEIRYDKYKNHLRMSPYCMEIKIEAKVAETGKIIMAEEPFFRLRRPDIEIEAPEKTSINKRFKVKLKLKTPIKQKLTNCSCSIEGRRIYNVEISKIEDKYLNDDGEWTQEVEITPTKKGVCFISVDFDCDQLQDIEGATMVEIE